MTRSVNMPTLLNQQSCHVFSAFISFDGEQVTIRTIWPATILLNSFCHFSGVLPKVEQLLERKKSERKSIGEKWASLSVEKGISIIFNIIYHSSVSHYSGVLMCVCVVFQARVLHILYKSGVHLTTCQFGTHFKNPQRHSI